MGFKPGSQRQALNDSMQRIGHKAVVLLWSMGVALEGTILEWDPINKKAPGGFFKRFPGTVCSISPPFLTVSRVQAATMQVFPL
jgi:hypothetical protein